MKKIVFVLTISLSATIAQAQAKLFSTISSEVKFFSQAPLEDIEAINKQASSVINADTKDVAVRIPIKGFVFPNGLMQEHFNENYLESDKYPNGMFRGKIVEDIDFTKDGSYAVSATGKFNIHGVEHDQTVKGKLNIVGGKITLDTNFDVLLVDYKIDIPKLVFQKIAEKINVNARFTYQVVEKKQ